MVSSVGEFAVSSVNIIDNINNLLSIAFITLCTGGSVVCSQYIGRKDHRNSSLASRQLVYVIISISVVISLVTLILRRPIVRGIYGNIEDNVMNGALIYFLVTASSYPALALYNACAALFRASGNSKLPMKVSLFVNVLNVGGNAFFVFVLHIGVLGVGLSTLICRVISAIVLFFMLYKNKRSPVSLSEIRKVTLIPSMIRRILNMGVPGGLEQSMFQLGRLLTQRIFPFFGTSIIAANAVASVLNSFCFQTGNAYCIAIITVVGQCIGAGDHEAAKKYTVKIIKITWITIITLASLLFTFRGALVGFFSLSPEAQAAARTFVTIHMISMVVGWTLSFVTPSALRAAGDARYVMVAGIVSMWTVRVCFAYFLTFVVGIGPIGVWLAQGGDFIFRSFLFMKRWKGEKWKTIKVIDS